MENVALHVHVPADILSAAAGGWSAPVQVRLAHHDGEPAHLDTRAFVDAEKQELQQQVAQLRSEVASRDVTIESYRSTIGTLQATIAKIANG